MVGLVPTILFGFGHFSGENSLWKTSGVGNAGGKWQHGEEEILHLHQLVGSASHYLQGLPG